MVFNVPKEPVHISHRNIQLYTTPEIHTWSHLHIYISCFYVLISYTLLFLPSTAPLLGLCHPNQETRHGRPAQCARVLDFISSPLPGAPLSIPGGWTTFIQHQRWVLPRDAVQLYHDTLRGHQPSENTWHIRHMHTHASAYRHKEDHLIILPLLCRMVPRCQWRCSIHQLWRVWNRRHYWSMSTELTEETSTWISVQRKGCCWSRAGLWPTATSGNVSPFQQPTN